MTSYHGGKQRIGLEIAENIHLVSTIIESNTKFKIKGYCEPFCGMLGVYKHVPTLFYEHKMKYKAGDTNESVIKMWQSAQKGWKPPTSSTEEEYNRLKVAKSSALKGFVGHQFSFGGQFFNGYAPKYGKTPDSTKASKSIIDISKKLQDVTFNCGSYTQFSTLKGYIIYCDPPYENTISRYYKNDKDDMLSFDQEKFWDWCRRMSQYNIVFISSYDAPNDFIKIMESSHKLTGISAGNNDKNRVEKLFTFRNMLS